MDADDHGQGSAPRLDELDIDRIARRVVELLRERPAEPACFVDAATVADRLGVDRGWVYQHARELGALRLGGEQGRLRFDLAAIQRQLAESPPPDPAPAKAAPRARQPRRKRGERPVKLIPYTPLDAPYTPVRTPPRGVESRADKGAPRGANLGGTPTTAERR